MERAGNLKMPFLLALLVIGLHLSGKIEAKVQCRNVAGCVKICGKCTAVACKEGLCECNCARASVAFGDVIKQQKPVQCVKPSDCVERCHGCTVNKCTAGLCVCGC